MKWWELHSSENIIHLDVADSCHSEAAQIAQTLAISAVESCFDLLYEGTGIRVGYFFELISLAKENNYEVNLIYVNTILKVSLERVKSRLLKTGRAVPVDIVKRSYLGGRSTYRQIASLARTASVWNLNVDGVVVCEKAQTQK
jgi:predicted ABC-type ATPase